MLDLKESGKRASPSREARAARSNGSSVSEEQMGEILGMEEIKDPRRPGWVDEYEGVTCEHGRPPPLCTICKEEGLSDF